MSLLRALIGYLTMKAFRVVVTRTGATRALLEQPRSIVTANHVSLLDGLLVAIASPVPLVFAVDPDFAVRNRGTALGLRLLSHLGFGEVIAIDSRSPFGLRKLLMFVRAGRPIMVFPEGAISPSGVQLPARPGVDWLQRRSGAQVIHVEIRGAENSRLFAKSGRQWRPSIELRF